jgi:predicted acyl esterase
MNDAVRLVEERDIEVTMRDGTKLAVDVYRPEAPGKYPVLYASALGAARTKSSSGSWRVAEKQYAPALRTIFG